MQDLIYSYFEFFQATIFKDGAKVKFTQKIEKDISDLKYAIHGNFLTQGISAGCELGVFDLFSQKNNTLSLDELAVLCKANSYALQKLLNFLVTLGLLDISKDRENYSLTEKGKLLQKDNVLSLHFLARMHASKLFRGASDFLTESIQYNKPGTSYFCHTDMFSYLAEAENEKQSEVFNKAMTNLTSIHAGEVAQFIKSLAPKTVLDAGGGIGTLICEVLNANTNTQGVIVDLPNVKKTALEYISKHGLTDRVTFVEKSFFEDFKQRADIITIHHVLHDYDDAGCIDILENCKKSLTSDGSILVIETLLGENAAVGIGWLKDLILHVTTPGGRVRKKSDFEVIFEKSNLEIKQVYKMDSSDLSIIQVQAKQINDF